MKLFFVFGILLLASCGTSQEASCYCVISALCGTDDTIITTGEGIIDTRLGEDACTCGQCKTSPILEVCCRLNSSQSTPDTPITRASVKNSQCGFANPDGIGYKMGSDSHETAFGEFPWMVGVLLESGTYRCGGSLIHPSVVLTAAHCVIKEQTYYARAGEWDSSNTTEIFKHQDRKVAAVKIHEDYQPQIYFNDIALLFLETPFVLAEHIKVVCLPPPNTVADSKECYATGWGRANFGGQGKFRTLLRKVLLPMVNNTQCQKNLRQTRLGLYFNLDKSFVCAGGKKDQDTCLGDGGGPLFCPISGEEDRYQQIGITAWGIGCNEDNVPGVYANVPLFREWIDKKMNEKNFEKTVYQY